MRSKAAVPATALEQSTKNRAKRPKIVEHLIKKRAKQRPETSPKIDGKPTNNPAKINPKSTKNPPRNHQNRSKIGPGGSLWRVLGPSGGLLEGSWGQDGPKANINQHNKHFSPLLGSKLSPKSSKSRTKIDTKCDQFFDCFLGSIFGAIWCQLGPNLAPKTLSKCSQDGFQKPFNKQTAKMCKMCTAPQRELNF